VASYAAGPPAQLSVGDVMAKNLVLRFVLVYLIPRAALAAAVAGVADALAAGALTKLPVHRFALEQIADAHDAVEAAAVGKVPVATRGMSSFTPVGDRALVVRQGGAPDVDTGAWRAFYAMTGRVAQALFPTLTQPLPSAAQARALVGEEAWEALVERPLGEALE